MEAATAVVRVVVTMTALSPTYPAACVLVGGGQGGHRVAVFVLRLLQPPKPKREFLWQRHCGALHHGVWVGPTVGVGRTSRVDVCRSSSSSAVCSALAAMIFVFEEDKSVR